MATSEDLSKLLYDFTGLDYAHRIEAAELITDHYHLVPKKITFVIEIDTLNAAQAAALAGEGVAEGLEKDIKARGIYWANATVRRV